MHVSLAPRRKGSPTVGEQQLKNRYFLFVLVTSGLLLAITGLAKLWSSLGAARALLAPDPLLGVPYKHLLAGVAVMEIVVATICFLGRSRHLALALVAYLSTNFMLYRIGLWWIGWKQPCGCMGSLTDALHIRPQTADHIAFVLLLYMLAASYALLVVLWKNSSWQSNPTSALLEEVSAQKDQL